MKFFRDVLFLLIFSSPAWAIHWEVTGQDSKEPVYKGDSQVDLKKSAGEISVQIFEKNKIPFQGNESGMNSILNTPTGEKATVIISDDTMRVYGWCYTVDGKGPDVMPDKFYFSKQDSVLSWFFAFSLYEHGEWKQYCAPAYTNPLNKAF